MLLIFILTACSSGRNVIIQRCPAMKPIEIKCDQAWEFTKKDFPDSPTPIEALQSRYEAALAELEEADIAIRGCRARNHVWEKAWESCGK